MKKSLVALANGIAIVVLLLACYTIFTATMYALQWMAGR